MKRSIIALLLIVPAIMESQLISFSYDASGNRIQRKKNLPPNPQTTSQEVAPFRISAFDLSGSRVYPVPVTETLTVEVGEIMLGCPVKICIMDMNGQIMTAIDTPETKLTIDVSDYPEGVYLVSICTSGQGEVHKIIKK